MLKCHNSFAKTASLQDKSLVITSTMKGVKNFTGEKSLYISSYRCHLIHLCTHNLPLLKFPTFAHIQFGGCEDLLSTKYHLEKQTAFYKPTLTFSAHNMFLQGIHKLQKLLHTWCQIAHTELCWKEYYGTHPSKNGSPSSGFHKF